MKLATFITVPLLAGGLALHYALSHGEYVDLSGSERLLNSRMTASREDFKSVGQDMVGFKTPITQNRPTVWRTSTDYQERFKAIQRIANYTVKIQTKCNAGTGWFLDHEIPTGGKTYPTKWWLATNAHVINTYKFADNPYNQVLPVTQYFHRSCRGEKGGPTEVFLMKDNSFVNGYVHRNIYGPIVNDGDKIINRLAWDAKGQPHNYLIQDFVYTQLKDPKLFYVPTDFLGQKYQTVYNFKGPQVHYIKDFAVLEVNFANEQEARNITNNLYELMKLNEYQINLFGPELMKTKTGDEMALNEEDYYFAGYSGSEDRRFFKYSLTTNFSYRGDKVGKLINVYDTDPRGVKNIEGKSLPGHYRSSQQLEWAGKSYNYWGYQYALANMDDVAPGASGSLITDSSGNALGILTSAYVSHGDMITAFATPLKSEGLVVDSRLVLPKYDLLNGTDWQLGSYREQLEKYHPNLETHLSRKFKAMNK